MDRGKGFGLAVVGVTLLILIAVARNSPSPNRAEPTASPSAAVSEWERVARAQAEVKRMLRNPSSAEFGEVRVSEKGGTAVVCGYVNSENGFGGMAGRQRFVSGSVTAIEEQMEPGGMDKVWGELCR